jgi:hypothetical protein
MNVTMAGCVDPVRRIQKLRERQDHLRSEIAMKEDQIGIMESEIRSFAEHSFTAKGEHQ